MCFLGWDLSVNQLNPNLTFFFWVQMSQKNLKVQIDDTLI